MSLLFRDFNILSSPNNSTNFTSVTAQRDPVREDDRRPRGKHHRHHQHHGHKSTSKRHCH